MIRPAAGVGLDQAIWGLHGARMALSSNSAEAMAYLRAHLGAGEEAGAGGEPDLGVRVEWSWGRRSAAARLAGGERVGKEFYEKDGRLFWTKVPGFEGVTMDAGLRLKRADLAVQCSYVPRDAFARVRYMRPGRRAKKTHRTFFKLMYYAAYYPMIWHLERTRGWGLLHASAVERNGRAILLSGMGGVGKSTLSLSLLADDSFRFVSDNLVLHDADTIYTLPEPVRLDASSLTAIAASGFAPTRSEVPPTAHPKPTYRVEPSRTVDKAEGDVVILLRFTPRSLIRPLNPSETLAHLTAARDLVKEVEGYRLVAAFLSMAVAGDRETPVEPASLASFAARQRAYLIGIGEGETVPTTLARIREICQ